MMRFSKEQIDAAKVDHAELFSVEIEGFDVEADEYYFRRPTRPEYASFMKTAMDEERRHSAMTQLVRDVIVLPSRAEFDELLKLTPGLGESIGAQVMKIAAPKAKDAKKA